jgi:hypothetical protein
MIPPTVPSSGDAATFHRPQTASGLRAAALELVRSGLKVRDVAQALQLSAPAVVALIREDTRRG